MKHLFKRNGRYYYNRRIPDIVKHHDPRESIRLSLKTDSYGEAAKRAMILNDQIEGYWQHLITTDKMHQEDDFSKMVKLTKLYGFRYQQTSKLLEHNITDLVSRLKALEETTPDNKREVNALLGKNESVDITISRALDKFWEFTKDRRMNKSPDQIRKWENPRKKAVNNFVKVVGDIPVKELDRSHVLKFRDWWIDKVQSGMNESSANKDLIHFKNIIETVSENMNLGLNTSWLFNKTNLKERFSQNRKPFTSEYIVDVLFNEDNLSSLNDEARNILYAAADTGARLAELVSLDKEDIILASSIPHIKICSKKGKSLKTPYSEREIPLVGYALQAFQAYPEGFEKYKNKSDTFSSATNKFFRENNLLPTEQHSIYSLRHSFQDRLLSVNAPDRIQAELMGHKFSRPLYGEGGSLDQKKEWMIKVALI